jgi:hypothetical protein
VFLLFTFAEEERRIAQLEQQLQNLTGKLPVGLVFSFLLFLLTSFILVAAQHQALSKQLLHYKLQSATDAQVRSSHHCFVCTTSPITGGLTILCQHYIVLLPLLERPRPRGKWRLRCAATVPVARGQAGAAAAGRPAPRPRPAPGCRPAPPGAPLCAPLPPPFTCPL